MEKVFFIGFAKTGTISLLHVMTNYFGFKCFHGGGRDLHRTKDETIEEELKRRGYSEMLNDCDVYIDWEYLSNKFETVYKHFPNARYIFNTRNVVDWVKSLKKHHSMLSQATIEKSGWYFVDEEERKEYYDIHTKKIMDFFKDKQDQFLVLDICGGDGYEKLCPFLGIDIPDEPFPHRHKRSSPHLGHFRRVEVNGFWYGSKLGELEKLCINSWIKNGYEFHLWLYDDIEVPKGVVVENANDIVSLDQYFTYTKGYTKNTPVAFSNLFRAHLLYQLGGLYIDLDVLCIQPQNFTERFVFTEQGHKLFDYHVGTCLIYAQDKEEQIFEDWIDWIDSLKSTSVSHGGLGPDLFTKLVIEHNFQEYVLDKKYYCATDYDKYQNGLKYKKFVLNYPNNRYRRPIVHTYGIHLYRSLWTDEDYNGKLFRENIDRLK